MANIDLLSKIIRGVWLMEPSQAEGFLPMVHSYVTKGTIPNFEKNEATQDYKHAIAAEHLHKMSFYNSLDDAPQGSMAVISIKGALAKNDYCGTPGTASIKNRILQADQHKNIKGTILLIDSPGGHVDGTEALANAVASTQKPVVALVDGLMASAAYWIGSAANQIIVQDQTAMIGSIGTMITLQDFKAYFEKEGLPVHEVFASKSTRKNALFKEVFEGNYKPIQNQILDPINEEFLNAVRIGRAGKLTNEKAVLNGEIFMAAQAVALGLADSIGTMADAIDAINEMAKNEESQTNPQTHMKIDMSKYPAVVELLGIDPAVDAAEGVHLQADNLETLEQSLKAGTDAAAQVTSLTADKSNLESQLSEANDKVKNLSDEKANLTQEVADLKAAHVPAPGAAANAVDSDKGGNGTDDEFLSETDAELDSILNQNKF